MLILLSMLAFSQEPCKASRETFLVGVEHAPPFVIKSGETWTGISVELWEKVAQENKFTYEYVDGNFSNLLSDLSVCALDVVIPAVTISNDREKFMDFSHPYLIEDIAIATNTSKSYWDTSLELFWHIIQPAATLVGVLCLSGFVYLLIEKPKYNVRNFLDSFYWAITTLTTVGYGDEAPKTPIGKMLATIWMFSSVFISASILAQIITTINSISRTPEIDDLSDLRGQEVITITDSFSSHLLAQQNIKHLTVPTELEAIQYLDENSAFVVYDRSILEYYFNNEVKILERGYYEQHLALAVSPGFSQLETINISLTSAIESGWWQTVLFKYQDKN